MDAMDLMESNLKQVFRKQKSPSSARTILINLINSDRKWCLVIGKLLMESCPASLIAMGNLLSIINNNIPKKLRDPMDSIFNCCDGNSLRKLSQCCVFFADRIKRYVYGKRPRWELFVTTNRCKSPTIWKDRKIAVGLAHLEGLISEYEIVPVRITFDSLQIRTLKSITAITSIQDLQWISFSETNFRFTQTHETNLICNIFGTLQATCAIQFRDITNRCGDLLFSLSTTQNIELKGDGDLYTLLDFQMIAMTDEDTLPLKTITLSHLSMNQETLQSILVLCPELCVLTLNYTDIFHDYDEEIYLQIGYGREPIEIIINNSTPAVIPQRHVV
eukprot:125284_1